VIPVKGNNLVLIVVAYLAVVAVAAFLAYNIGLGIEVPGNYLYFGRTVDASGLYDTGQFSWYTYDQLAYWVNQTDPPVVRMTFEYGNATYNGTPCLHERSTYRTAYGTGDGFIQVNDCYFGADGKYIADGFNVFFANGTFRNNGTFHDRNDTYKKWVFLLPYGCQVAPRGTETIAVGDRTYVCDKYYLPNQNINGQCESPATFWFNASIPVPVKVQSATMNVAFELVDWG
jgi:hypothetical protein